MWQKRQFWHVGHSGCILFNFRRGAKANYIPETSNNPAKSKMADSDNTKSHISQLRNCHNKQISRYLVFLSHMYVPLVSCILLGCLTSSLPKDNVSLSVTSSYSRLSMVHKIIHLFKSIPVYNFCNTQI